MSDMHYITKYCKNEKFSIESCTCYNPNFHYKLLIQDELVKVIIITDIESINYGRGVGYDIIEYIPPKEIAAKIHNHLTSILALLTNCKKKDNHCGNGMAEEQGKHSKYGAIECLVIAHQRPFFSSS